MHIQKFVVQINKTNVKGYPVKSGLIFTTNNLSSIQKITLKKYQNWNQIKYNAFKKEIDSRSSEPLDFEPVAYFENTEQNNNFEIDYPRTRRFVVLLPNSMNSSTFKNAEISKSPIEIKHFGVFGRTYRYEEIN